MRHGCPPAMETCWVPAQLPRPAQPFSGALPASLQVPGPKAEGVEREIKWGQNIPASAEQAKEELKYVGANAAVLVGSRW